MTVRRENSGNTENFKKKYKKNSKKKFQIFFFKFVHASFELTRLEWKLDIGKFDLEMKNLIIYIIIFVL